MSDLDSAVRNEDAVVVLRISSSNFATRVQLGVLTAIVSVLAFIALHASSVWIAVAFFALVAAAFASMVVLPYDLTLELNRETVSWTRGRNQMIHVRADEVASIVLDSEGYSSLTLTNGQRTRLPDDLFAYAQVDLEQLSSRWLSLWPGKPLWLRNQYVPGGSSGT